MHNALISDLTTRERQRKSGPASNLLLSLILSALEASIATINGAFEDLTPRQPRLDSLATKG